MTEVQNGIRNAHSLNVPFDERSFLSAVSVIKGLVWLDKNRGNEKVKIHLIKIEEDI